MASPASLTSREGCATGVSIPVHGENQSPISRRFSIGIPFAVRDTVILPKRFVYVLRSRHTPSRYYTGLTSDVAARVAAHNTGHCTHTATERPWEIDVVIEFGDKRRAAAFERYLKSGSGAPRSPSATSDDSACGPNISVRAVGAVVMGIQVRGPDERPNAGFSPRAYTMQTARSRPEDCVRRYAPRRTTSQAVPTVPSSKRSDTGPPAV